jgi:heme O synthase-like polyprenyltransferase
MKELGMENATAQRRRKAIKRLKDKKDFKNHLLTYVTVNAMLVVIWAFTGAGSFWPLIVMAAWGIVVVVNAYEVYRGHDYTETDIEREMKKLP